MTLLVATLDDADGDILLLNLFVSVEGSIHKLRRCCPTLIRSTRTSTSASTLQGLSLNFRPINLSVLVRTTATSCA